MAQNHFFSHPAFKSPLNPDYYNLCQDEREFFQKLTGIADDDALKAHIITVQAKAYEVIDWSGSDNHITKCLLLIPFTSNSWI